MDNKNKITMRVPPESLLDPIHLRAKQIQEEEEKRFNKIAEQILEILKKENVLVSEIPRIVSTFSNKINTKIDNSSIKCQLELK